MTSRRVQKAAQAIREVVSMAILADLKDPRVEGVTVTYVEVTGDMRHAKVNVSVMGDEKQQQLCLHGLQSAAGYLQRKVGDRIDTRYTPRLEFVLDMGVKKSIEISRILKGVLPEEAADGEEDAESTPLQQSPHAAPHRDATVPASVSSHDPADPPSQDLPSDASPPDASPPQGAE